MLANLALGFSAFTDPMVWGALVFGAAMRSLGSGFIASI